MPVPFTAASPLTAAGSGHAGAVVGDGDSCERKRMATSPGGRPLTASFGS